MSQIIDFVIDRTIDISEFYINNDIHDLMNSGKVSYSIQSETDRASGIENRLKHKTEDSSSDSPNERIAIKNISKKRNLQRLDFPINLSGIDLSRNPKSIKRSSAKDIIHSEAGSSVLGRPDRKMKLRGLIRNIVQAVLDAGCYQINMQSNNKTMRIIGDHGKSGKFITEIIITGNGPVRMRSESINIDECDLAQSNFESSLKKRGISVTATNVTRTGERCQPASMKQKVRKHIQLINKLKR